MIDMFTRTHELIEEPHDAVVAVELTPDVQVHEAMAFAHEYEGGRHWPLGALPKMRKATVLEKKPCLSFIPEFGQEYNIGAGWVIYAAHGLPVQAAKVADFLAEYRPIPVSVGPAEGQDVP